MTKPIISFRNIKWVFLFLLISLTTFSGCRFFQDRSGGTFSATHVRIDINAPDVMILSQNLSQLPRDILSIPVLNELLTEDFVFYYDNAPARLSIQGTMNRMAFEHKLTMQDKIIQKVLAEPSEFYVWKGETGKPNYWLIVTKNTYLTQMGEIFSKIALNDSQLVEAGKIKVDGKDIPLYALNYQGHTGLFASVKGRFVFLSDAGMLFEQTEEQARPPRIQADANYQYTDDGDAIVEPVAVPKAQKLQGELIEERARVVENLLSADKAKSQTLSGSRQLTLPAEGHTVFFSPALLSLSYEHLMPGFGGVRFDYQQQKWQNQVAVTSTLLPEAGWNNQLLFQAVPQNASLCGSAPLNWQSMGQENQSVTAIKDAKLDFSQFDTPVLSCWFEGSPFSAPLFITHLKSTEPSPEQLEQYYTLFNQTIGAKEYTNKKRFDVERTQIAQDVVSIKRLVSARYGSHSMNHLTKEMAAALSADAYFPVTLAVAGSYVFFSPNEDLVKQAIAVYQKKYPAAADQMKNPQGTLIWVNTPSLSKLIGQQMKQVIQNSDMEAVAETQITPKLDLLAKQAKWSVSLNSQPKIDAKSQLTWLPVQWQEQAQ